MILGDPDKWDAYADAGVYGELTLDELLRRAALDHHAETALSCDEGTGASTSMSWGELDARVSQLADFLLDLGMKQDDPVIVLAGAGAQAATALLALSRAGMIAVPLSPVTGARETAAIAETLGARAIIAESRVGPRELAEVAAMAAFSAFNIRFLLGFGSGLPDGVIGLDEILGHDAGDSGAPGGAMRGGRASDHVFVMTCDGDGAQRSFPARNHGQLIAATLPLVAYGGFSASSVIATPLIASSLAGLSLLSAWLISRSRLHFLAPWESEGIAEAATAAGATHLAVAGQLCGQMGTVGEGMMLIRSWRDTVEVGATNTTSTIDIVSLGEAALMVYRGGEDRSNIIPLKGLQLDGDSGPASLEPRIQGIVHKAGAAIEPGSLMRGPLGVRGPGTPVMAFAKDETGKTRFVENGFMLTGLRGELAEADGPVVRVLGAMGKSVRTGQIALDLAEVDTLYAGIEGLEDAAAVPVKHPILGHVLTMAYVGQAELMLEDVAEALEAAGISAYKMPVSLLRVDAIPRDADGAVARNDIGHGLGNTRAAQA